jgi:cobalt-zinc-cadmium efflux system outer membrane protein
MAIQRNQDLLAARERVAEAQGLLRQAGVRLAPTVEVQGRRGSPLNTGKEVEYTASFFYPIETAGKRPKRVEVAKIGLALAEAEVADRTRQLTFEVRRRAAELVAAEHKQQAIDHLLNVNRETFRVTEVRVQQGDAALLEQKLLATELSRVEAQQASFVGIAAAAVPDLRQVVGAPATESLRISDDEASEQSKGTFTLEELQERARNTRPDLRAAHLLEEQAGAEVALTRAQGRPDITASASYGRRSSYFDQQFAVSPAGIPIHLQDTDNVLGVGLAVPLFTGRRNRGNVEAAVAREHAAERRRAYLDATVPLEVEAAYRRWQAARRAVSLFTTGVVSQSEQNLAVIRQAYTLGQLRVLDVLAEQRRLIDTQLAYVDAQKELMQSTAELERAVGGSLQ